MTYFKLMIGLDCGLDKSVCQFGYPENCTSCLSKKFSDANLLIDIIEATEQQSEQKRKNVMYKNVWMKYQDISTIRHILILTKGGIPAFNMAIGDLPIDATLISGFIHANISFSSKELTMIDRINPEKRLYELEYKNFYLLLSNGNLCRICLILDKKASNNLRELLSNFTDILEENYKDKIKEFENLCEISILDPVKSLIEKSFELNLNCLLTFSPQIPPNIINNFSLIQKAIYECAKDLLKEEPFFYISRLIQKTLKLLGVISKEQILWYIRQMIIENIIIIFNFEDKKQELEYKKQDEQEREAVIQKFMEIKNLEEIIFDSHDMSLDDAYMKINSSLKKGEIAEENAAYQEALIEYQNALNYAKEFNLETDIKEISSKMIEIRKLNREVELNFAMKQADKSELKRDYVITLKYLFQIRDILSAKNDNGKHDKELQKLDHRIERIQKHFK